MDGKGCRIWNHWLVHFATSACKVFFAKPSDGSGIIQRANAFYVVLEQRRIEVVEVVIDAAGHLSVHVVQRKCFALKQAGAVSDKALLYPVDRYPIGDVCHSKGMSDRLVWQRLLPVEHREQDAEEYKAFAWSHFLMGVGNQMGGNGKFPLIRQDRVRGITTCHVIRIKLGGKRTILGGAGTEVISEGVDQPSSESIMVADAPNRQIKRSVVVLAVPQLEKEIVNHIVQSVKQSGPEKLKLFLQLQMKPLMQQIVHGFIRSLIPFKDDGDKIARRCSFVWVHKFHFSLSTPATRIYCALSRSSFITFTGRSEPIISGTGQVFPGLSLCVSAAVYCGICWNRAYL